MFEFKMIYVSNKKDALEETNLKKVKALSTQLNYPNTLTHVVSKFIWVINNNNFQ